MENSELKVFNKTIIFDENNVIFVHPICDFFEINRENQTRIIKNDIILQRESTKKSNKNLFGDNFPRLCLTKKGFIRWIQILNPSIIKDELQEQFTNYQSLVFDYLYGEALVPNIKRQFEIEIELKELNKVINKSMIRHRELEIEKRNLSISNYRQLGLEFTDETIPLPTYNQKNKPLQS